MITSACGSITDGSWLIESSLTWLEGRLAFSLYQRNIWREKERDRINAELKDRERKGRQILDMLDKDHTEVVG